MLRQLLTLLCVASLCIINSCGNKQGKSLNIATSANMQFAMEALSKKFYGETGIATNVILGSSGKLTAQIKAGAPYDVFVSADTQYPNTVFESGLATGPPKIYAYGQLILWTYGSELPDLPEALTLDEIQHVALANPDIAPYGKAAIETLEYLKLLDSLESKLVFGESIAQTNQFIISGAAYLGFTAKSVVLSPRQRGKGFWIDIPPNHYNPISQGAVLLTNRKEMEAEAQQFYDFLFSDDAKEILNKFGYTSVN